MFAIEFPKIRPSKLLNRQTKFVQLTALKDSNILAESQQYLRREKQQTLMYLGLQLSDVKADTQGGELVGAPESL